MIHKLHGHRGAGSRANTQKHAHHGNVLLCLDPKSHQISPPRWKSRWPSRWWWWWLQLGQGKVSLKYATRPYRDREGRHAIVTPLATMQIQYSFCAVVRISLPISGSGSFNRHTWHSGRLHVSHTESLKKIRRHLHPVPYYHVHWYRTFSEQLVIEFGKNHGLQCTLNRCCPKPLFRYSGNEPSMNMAEGGKKTKKRKKEEIQSF